MTNFNILNEGTKLNGRYEIKSHIGCGGMGNVYRCKDTVLDVTRVAKEHWPYGFVMREGNTVIPLPQHRDIFIESMNRFLSEGKTIAQLKHPFVVNIYDCLEEYGTGFLIMEDLGNQTLEMDLREKEIYSESEILSIILPLANALSYIHNMDILHRDMKPSNILLVGDDRTPVLVDFGSSKQGWSSTTQKYTSILTPSYSPIEQYFPEGTPHGPWSDVFSLSAVLWELMVGAPPLSALSRLRSSYDNSVDDPLVPIENIARMDYPENFYKAVNWGLALHAEDRPTDVESWLEILVNNEPVAYSAIS